MAQQKIQQQVTQPDKLKDLQDRLMTAIWYNNNTLVTHLVRESIHENLEKQALNFVAHNIGDIRCENFTPLTLACLRENYSICKTLLKFGAAVDKKDGRGFTPLHVICSRSMDADATDPDDITPLTIATLLLKHGANVNIPCSADVEVDSQVNVHNPLNATALHFACERSALPIVKLLVNNQAAINDPFHSGHMPRAIAASMYKKDVVKYLDSLVTKDGYAICGTNGLLIQIEGGHAAQRGTNGLLIQIEDGHAAAQCSTIAKQEGPDTLAAYAKQATRRPIVNQEDDDQVQEESTDNLVAYARQATLSTIANHEDDDQVQEEGTYTLAAYDWQAAHGTKVILIPENDSEPCLMVYTNASASDTHVLGDI